MPGLADLLYLGQPDPARQLAALLAGRQQAQGAPPGPAGPAPAPPNPNAPAPDAQPVSAAPGAGAPGAPPPPGSPPQPAALQSTPDMSQSYQQLANPPNIMSLYMQMDARNRASDQINRGFALIAANHSSPAMAQAIMQSVGGGPDAGQQANNLMSIYQGQQQMAAQQQMLGQASEIAQKTGYPEAFVRAEIMAGRGNELMRGMQAPEAIRSLQWARKIYKDEHPNATQDEIEAAVPMAMYTGGGGGGDATQQSWLHARSLVPPSEWGDHPEFSDALTYGLYVQDQKKRQEATDASAAGFGQYHGGLMDVRGKVASIQSNPELDKVLQSPALLAAVKAQREGTFSGDIKAWLGQNHYSAEQMQLVNDILDLSDPDYLKALQGKASASTQGDVLPVTQALGALGRLGTAPKQYKGMLTGALDAVDNADANAYGASGQLDAIDDDNKRKRVSGAYLPGGASFVGRGKKMPPDEIEAAKQSMKDTPKAEVIDLYRRHGYNTKPIE